MINVTKSFLPPIEEYTSYLQKIWESGHLTNHGPFVCELEEKLKKLLGVKHLFYVNNGTIAIQIALKALDIKGKVITTPFSYVATTSSIVWENAEPIFADIFPDDLTIDANEVEKLITPDTTAILATHVYGIPCHVKELELIAKKHQLKIIYDAAHAFGVEYEGTSILNFGDVSTLSFHATKLFHTVEGGAIVTNNDELANRISFMRNFGHNGQEAFWGVGINGKASEFHAAMGLSVLPYLEKILNSRKEISNLYHQLFEDCQIKLDRPSIKNASTYNFAYFPILFKNENQLLKVRDALNEESIFPRRYFYPSLNNLPYVHNSSLPITESVAVRVLCLPLYHDLSSTDVKKIVDIVVDNLS